MTVSTDLRENMSTRVKHRIQGKGPDVKAAGCRKSKRLCKKHDDQIPKELAAGNMSAHATSGGKSLEVDPLVSHWRMLKKKFMLENMSTHESVGVKHKIQGKGPDVKAVGIRKSERLRKKHDDQIPKELAADKMKEKSDVDQKTCYDGFLGKQVPVIEGQELGGGCAVCGAWDHFHVDCPCLKYFPKGTQIGVHYETMCRGCDRIGEVCCNEGGFALMKVCAYCCEDGHWQWEDCEDCSRPKDLVFEKPEFFYKMEDGEPIPMWLRT